MKLHMFGSPSIIIDRFQMTAKVHQFSLSIIVIIQLAYVLDH